MSENCYGFSLFLLQSLVRFDCCLDSFRSPTVREYITHFPSLQDFPEVRLKPYSHLGANVTMFRLRESKGRLKTEAEGKRRLSDYQVKERTD